MNPGEMNLHPQAEAFLNWLINRSLQAGVLVLMVMLVQAVFRRQLTNRWRFALWWIPLLRLLLPGGPESAVSVFNFVKPTVSIAGPRYDLASLPAPSPERVVPPKAIDFPGSQTPAAGNGAGPVPDSLRARLLRNGDFEDWVFPSGLILLWAAVAVVFSLVVVTQSLHFRRKLSRSSAPADPALVELLAECRRDIRVARRVELQETDAVASPALWGLLRLRILLPRGMAAKFSRRELRYIFLHELAHVKRGDLWLNWLLTALQFMHWFNPLVWLGFARLRADRELACDELALVSAGETAGMAYGQTVIKLLEGLSRPRAVPGLIGILEDKKQMRRRISMLANFRRPGRKSALAVILLALVAAVALTDAQTDAALPANVTPIAAQGNATLGATNELPTTKPIPGATLKGRVISPDGTPAAGAEVALRLGPGYLDGPYKSGLDATTGPDGSFSTPLYEAVQSVITFNSKGIARVSLADLQASPKIQLQKWGRIEGTLMMGSHPGSNETLSAGTAVGSPAFRLLHETGQWNTSPRLHDIEQTRTDEQGRFVFDRVSPGEISLDRMVNFSGGEASGAILGTVEVKPGETTRVTLGGTGRAVVGELKLPSGETNHFYELHSEFLSSSLEKLAFQMQNLKTEQERVAFSQTEEYVQAARQGRTFPITISSDGSFALEDVLPGTYKLDSWTAEAGGQGSLYTSDELTAPKATNESDHTAVDLGTIKMKKITPWPPATVPGSNAATLPQWQPEPLPAVKSAGDLQVRLEKFVGRPYPSDHGHFHYDFLLEFTSARTNETWAVEDAELSDTAGNRIATTQSDLYGPGFSHPGISGSIEGVLSPDQPALRLKVGLKRTTGIPPQDLITFSNVPLSGKSSQTNLAFGTPIVVANYWVELANGRGVVFSGFFDTNWVNWVEFEPPDPKSGLVVDIINVVTDTDQRVDGKGISTGRSHWNFAAPPGTKYLKVTLAVQKPRHVEFVAKPVEE